MRHLLLHAAGNMRARALRLIQLHDVALLAAQFGRDDWEELLRERSDDQGIWWAFAPMMLTARYYPGVIPPGVLARLRTHCPTLLRKHTHRQGLVGVSWSNILIEAFPGVEWSRTPGEALIFMKSRIWPSRNALIELKRGGCTDPGCFRGPLVRVVARQAYLAMDLHPAASGTDSPHRARGLVARSLTNSNLQLP